VHHPHLVNSVPRVERWLVDYYRQYVDAAGATQFTTPTNTLACAGTLCFQGTVYTADMLKPPNPGFACVFYGSTAKAVSTLPVAALVPLTGYVVAYARYGLLPGVTADVIATSDRYNCYYDSALKATVGPMTAPPTSVQAKIAAVYVRSNGTPVSFVTWTSDGSRFYWRTGGLGDYVVPILSYTGELIRATAKVDHAAYGLYTFLVKYHNETQVYAFTTYLAGSQVSVPISAPAPGYYQLEVFYNGSRVRSATYWIEDGGLLYLGAIGPPLIRITHTVSPVAAPPIPASTVTPIEWVPSGLPLPAPTASNPIDAALAAGLSVALAAAYVAYKSSRNPTAALAAALVAFMAVSAVAVPQQHQGVLAAWAPFLIVAAALAIILYMMR
jgi:hypothetical protein